MLHSLQIHHQLVKRSMWGQRLKQVSWRVDVKTKSRHIEQLNVPTGILEMKLGKEENDTVYPLSPSLPPSYSHSPSLPPHHTLPPSLPPPHILPPSLSPQPDEVVRFEVDETKLAKLLSQVQDIEVALEMHSQS